MIPDDIHEEWFEAFGPERHPATSSEFHEGVERFTIETPGQADWALRKIANLRRDRKGDEELVNEEHRRLREWFARREESRKRDEGFFTSLLEHYHRRRHAADEKLLTVDLPGGKLKLRKAPDAWEFDEEKFLAFARANNCDNWVRTKTEVAVSEVKRSLKDRVANGHVVTDDGEPIPGVTVHAGERRFEVET